MAGIFSEPERAFHDNKDGTFTLVERHKINDQYKYTQLGKFRPARDQADLRRPDGMSYIHPQTRQQMRLVPIDY